MNSDLYLKTFLLSEFSFYKKFYKKYFIILKLFYIRFILSSTLFEIFTVEFIHEYFIYYVNYEIHYIL